MSKRRWPDFYQMCYDKRPHSSMNAFMQDWLEANIPKEVLDKLAPKIEEPRKACAFVGKLGSVYFVIEGREDFDTFAKDAYWTRRPELDIGGK